MHPNERMKFLRQKFSHKTTVYPNGTIKQEYFYPKKAAQDWTDLECIQLFKGVYKHGVAEHETWQKIAHDFVPGRVCKYFF